MLKGNLTALYPNGFDAASRVKIEDHTPHSIQFEKELERFGMEVKTPPKEGEFTRYRMTDGKRKNTNGWCLWFGTDPANGISGGIYGDWRTDSRMHWSSKADIDMTSAEQIAHKARVRNAREKAERARAARQDEAANEAANLIRELPLAAKHPYLERKGVSAYGLYIEGDALVVPRRNAQGEMRSIQRIYANGDKRYMSGGQARGTFHLIGSAFTEPTYIAEGYATAATIHEVTGKSVVVAFDSGNLPAVVADLRESGNQCQFVICADNDRNTDGNPGVSAAQKAAEGQFGVRVVIPEISGTDGTDFNDLFAAQGADEVRRQVVGDAATGRDFKLIQIGELGDIEPTSWLIDGIVPDDSFGSLYGPSGVGKSFSAIDMCMCIASGIDWHGRDVTQGGVVYVCGEGKKGINKRVSGWAQAHGIKTSDIPMYISSTPVEMLNPDMLSTFRNSLTNLVASIGNIRFVVIDTLNRNFGDGDENRTEDMTRFIGACCAVQADVGASVMVVHHTGKDADRGARGSSALRAALDFEMKTEETAEGLDLSCTKMKDDEAFKTKSFSIENIQLPNDQTSRIPRLIGDADVGKDAANAFRSAAKMTQYQQTTFNTIRDEYRKIKTNLPDEKTPKIERKTINSALEASGARRNHWSRHISWAHQQKLLRTVNSQTFEILYSE